MNNPKSIVERGFLNFPEFKKLQLTDKLDGVNNYENSFKFC